MKGRFDVYDSSKNLLRSLLDDLVKYNSVGTLANLRKVVDGKQFSSDSEQQQAYSLAGLAHLASYNLNANAQSWADYYFRQAHNEAALEQLARLNKLYQDPFAPKKSRAGVDYTFRQYCEQQDIIILKVLQEGIDDVRRCSYVYLVWDTDGIVKIYKEVLDYSHGPLGQVASREDELYMVLPDNSFLPKCYGVVDIYPFRFLKLSVHFGQTLADYTQTGMPIPAEAARYLIHEIATALAMLHKHNILYLDLKPEHLIVHPEGVRLLDLGISRRIKSFNDEVDIYLADPRMATPEGVTRLKASTASDVYQLGILYYLLLTGHYPLQIDSLVANDTRYERESAILKYAWSRAALEVTWPDDAIPQEDQQLLKSMLSCNPLKRPSMEEVGNRLNTKNHKWIHRSPRPQREKKGNSVFFPARMGIPHRGHIEYMCRILELGYHLVVDIECNHILTERDPIPKFYVHKMVAKSLMDRGFTPEVDFSFVFTPLYETREELELHYATLPMLEDIVAIASSNPRVHDVFHGFAFFDQGSVFGTEGQRWQDRSWGEFVRKGIRDNDYQMFLTYAATGVESILNFDAIRTIYAKPYIEFAVQVLINIQIPNQKEPLLVKALQYRSAEQSALFYLQTANHRIQRVDLYQSPALVTMDGHVHQLLYMGTEFESKQKIETVHFLLQ